MAPVQVLNDPAGASDHIIKPPLPLEYADAAGVSSLIGRELNAMVMRLVGTHVDDDGFVRYPALQASVECIAFAEFAATRLQLVNPADWSHAERLAFFLNLYNAMTIHAKIMHPEPTSMTERAAFFAGVSYRFGSVLLSLDEVEHGLLRRAPHPTTGRTYFDTEAADVRLSWRVDALDPRIHFALVRRVNPTLCGSDVAIPGVRAEQNNLIEESRIGNHSVGDVSVCTCVYVFVGVS